MCSGETGLRAMHGQIREPCAIGIRECAKGTAEDEAMHFRDNDPSKMAALPWSIAQLAS